jgi:hypothetical protein
MSRPCSAGTDEFSAVDMRPPKDRTHIHRRRYKDLKGGAGIPSAKVKTVLSQVTARG